MHGMQATFMAKPFGEDLGSGLHVHVSVLDADGGNIFAAGSGNKPADALAHATGGLLATMGQMQAIYTPNPNSIRRLQAGSFAPDQITWGLDHRAAAVRLPEINGPGARLEHRICGADANPYLVVTAILAGMLYGLDNSIDPGHPIDGADSNSTLPTLRKDLSSAVEAFANSQFAQQTFGKDFHLVYTNLRRHEIAQMAKLVSDVELRLYLGSA